MFVSNVLAKSTNLTSSPTAGAAGKVIVKGALVVLQNILVSQHRTSYQNFSLTPETIEGKEVVVIADRPMIHRDLTASQKITTADEIADLPVESFIGVLVNQAGVNQGAGGEIHIRGGRYNEVGYYIDGVSVSNPFPCGKKF